VAKSSLPTSKAEAHAAHGHGPGRYFVIWIALLSFTVLTVYTGRMNLGSANLPLAMVIATTKATLVVLFFMHLSESHGVNRLVFLVSVIFMLVLMTGVFGDLAFRYPLSLPSDATPMLENGSVPAAPHH
jgi:cytochrome c oxidase subunit 4